MIAIDQALYYLRNRLSPRGMQRLAESAHDGDACVPEHGEAIPVLYAILSGGEEVTVGAVADWLCIDPSRASRMVSAAIAAGHATRLASQADGRRTVLELTQQGRDLIDSVNRYRQQAYQTVLADWTAEERAEFARLLNKFGEAMGGGGC